MCTASWHLRGSSVATWRQLVGVVAAVVVVVAAPVAVDLRLVVARVVAAEELNEELQTLVCAGAAS